MRHAVRVLIAACCLAVTQIIPASVLHAQTADELIAKNIEARGGIEKIRGH